MLNKLIYYVSVTYMLLYDIFYRKSFILAALFFLFLVAPQIIAQQSSAYAEELSKLSWLAGHWERLEMKDDMRGEERWILTSDTLYEGVGITTKGNDTLFVEQLEIVSKEDTLFYVADVPENPSPVWFEIVEIGEQYFKSENQEHDFPKMISYFLKNKLLSVVISGDNKEVEYHFRKKSN